MSDHIQYEAPRPSPGQLTVTIPLSYFNMLVESYYTGRREAPQVRQEPVAPESDQAFINRNFNGIDLLEDMPSGWTRVQKRVKTDGQ